MAAALLVLTSAPHANAVYLSTGMSSQTFCTQNPSVNPTWLTPINNGRNAWNNHANFPGTISLYSACTSTIAVGSYGLGFFGRYTPLIVGSQYKIQLDSAEINAHVSATGYTFANVAKSTTAHEFGHALRLGDLASGSSLMSSARSRNTVTGPTSADVTESNGYY